MDLLVFDVQHYFKAFKLLLQIESVGVLLQHKIYERDQGYTLACLNWIQGLNYIKINKIFCYTKTALNCFITAYFSSAFYIQYRLNHFTFVPDPGSQILYL